MAEEIKNEVVNQEETTEVVEKESFFKKVFKSKPAKIVAGVAIGLVTFGAGYLVGKSSNSSDEDYSYNYDSDSYSEGPAED